MAQNLKNALVRRLKRIEGQTRGVQKMIEEERDCAEILNQLTAINEAVRSVSLMLVEQYAINCLRQDSPRSKSRQAVTAVLDVIAHVPR